MIQQDSIAFPDAGMPATDGGDYAPHHVLTPRMVLSWLPPNATPAQQDSAIQAHFKPAAIRWSLRPDTLHLPGHDKGRNLLDVQLPKYYREGYFSGDSLFHPELPGGRYGVAGAPVPYNLQGDHVITLMLMVFFVTGIISVSHARGFIARQFKSLFYPMYAESGDITETASEVRFQTFLAFLTCVMQGLLFYLYTLWTDGSTTVLSSHYYLILIYIGVSVGYYLVKMLAYTAVNLTFFNGKRNVQWIKVFLFITSIEGVMLFPAVLLQAYYGLSLQNVFFYSIFVLVIVKLLVFYKSFIIFFKRNVVQSQIFLYFCTLEIMPLLAFMGALEFIADSLKINF